MNPIHVIVDHEGFWDRNAAELTFISTMALVVLTVFYVWFTRGLFQADSDALEAAREGNKLNREANKLAQSSVDLATKARIDSATPTATVYSMEADWGGVNPGVTSLVPDPQTMVELKLLCAFISIGTLPTVIECEPPNIGEWYQTRYFLIPDTTRMQTQLVWHLTAPVEAFQRLANEQHALTLTVRTHASAGGAVDTHTWNGRFIGTELDSGGYSLKKPAFGRQGEPWTQRRDYD